VPRRGPDFELRVARRAHLQQIVVAAIVELEPPHALRVAAIEALRQPQDRGQRAHSPAFLALQIPEAVVAAFGRRLAVIPRHERHHLDLVGLESAEIAVLD
jgi:hypothetical protein